MVLVDIGNTHFHILKDGKILHSLKPLKLRGEIFYISVNKKKEKEFLTLNPKAINLAPFVKFDTSYKGLGIDRIMACKSVEDGVVVDAGSAITIDVMEKKHLGGIIMPGLRAFRESFAKISPKLNLEFVKINLASLPQNTAEAISYGSIGAVVRVVESLKGDKKIYLTGGDGEFLREYLGGEYIEDLVFRGMIKTIKEDL